MSHDIHDLIALFSKLFAVSERTVLVRGDNEPYYRPWSADCRLAEVVFAHGFFASALHEVAHWCIAGRERRALSDYGYWYKPDGRSSDEQREFERVEVSPQALEWIFSVAAGTAFHFSADNLSEGGAVASPAWIAFQNNVANQACRYVTGVMPKRAAAFATALAERYETGGRWQDAQSYGVGHATVDRKHQSHARLHPQFRLPTSEML